MDEQSFAVVFLVFFIVGFISFAIEEYKHNKELFMVTLGSLLDGLLLGFVSTVAVAIGCVAVGVCS